MPIWATGPGTALNSPGEAMDRLDGQLQERTAGAQKAAVAELVQAGHVSTALQVQPSTVTAPVNFMYKALQGRGCIHRAALWQ